MQIFFCFIVVQTKNSVLHTSPFSFLLFIFTSGIKIFLFFFSYLLISKWIYAWRCYINSSVLFPWELIFIEFKKLNGLVYLACNNLQNKNLLQKIILSMQEILIHCLLWINFCAKDQRGARMSTTHKFNHRIGSHIF